MRGAGWRRVAVGFAILSVSTVAGAALFAPERGLLPARPLSLAETVSVSSPPVVEPVPGQGEETIRLTMKVVPASAQVFIDGRLMPSTFSVRFPRDGSSRRIRVTAPGYRPWDRRVVFAENLVVELSLPRVRAPRARPRLANGPSAHRAIEARNPYAEDAR